MQILQRYKFKAILPLDGTILYGGFLPSPVSQPKGYVVPGSINKPLGAVRSGNDEKPRMALTVDNSN